MNYEDRYKITKLFLSEKPVITVLSPVEVFVNLNLNLSKFLKTFEEVIDHFHNSVEETVEYLRKILNNKNVDSVFLFGSAVYRMMTKEEISDVDFFVLFKDHPTRTLLLNHPNGFHMISGDLNEMKRHLENNNYGFEEVIFASEIVILKRSENLKGITYEMRKRFSSHWIEIMEGLMCRDVVKEIHSKRILKYIEDDEKLRDKIENAKGFTYSSPAMGEVSSYPSHLLATKFKNNNFEIDEMVKIFKAVLKRRRVKPTKQEPIIRSFFEDRRVKRILRI